MTNTRPYGSWTAEEIAALFAKWHVQPARGRMTRERKTGRTACALGVLYHEYGMTWKALDAAPLFGPRDVDLLPRHWTQGFWRGFDAVDPSYMRCTFEEQMQFDTGYTLGRRVAELVGLAPDAH